MACAIGLSRILREDRATKDGGAGYLFGNIPFIKNNLSLILILGIISAITGPILVGAVLKYFQRRREARTGEKD